MKFDLQTTRRRIQNHHFNIEHTLTTRMALGGYKHRERFHCSTAQLWDIAQGQEKALREDAVKLVVLQTAVNSNPLIRWLIERWTRRIAKALDG